MGLLPGQSQDCDPKQDSAAVIQRQRGSVIAHVCYTATARAPWSRWSQWNEAFIGQRHDLAGHPASRIRAAVAA